MLKQALIAYVSNTVKAIWSVVAHPLTIVGSKNGNVKDYKIYGNSVQNGEPTPDNPVEVQSVGEYDEESGKYKVPITVRGKNILDMSQHTVTAGYYLDSSGTASSSNTNFLKLSMIEVKPNTTYTISSNLYFYTIWFSSNNSLNGGGISKVNAYNVKKKKFTTPEGCNYIRVSFDLRTSNQGGQGVGVFEWAMLEVGEGDGIYEPYIEPQTVNIYLDEPLRTGQVMQKSKDNLPSLPQFEGTTVYEAQTEIPPSGIQIQYY